MSDRLRLQDTIRRLGEQVCCYGGGTWPETRRCDCKYGGPTKGMSEQTGCPELRDTFDVLGQMTDAEWDMLRARRYVAAIEGPQR